MSGQLMGPIPTMILGGSDLRTAPPRKRVHVESQRDLAGYKGAAIRLEGVPLIRLLIERLQSSGVLDPICVVGPARIYREAVSDQSIIDTDGSFSQNVSVATSWLAEHFPGSPAAFTTCDILPELNDLDRLLEAYRQSKGSVVWYPLIRAPLETQFLGASFWKPQYTIVDAEGRPIRVLPCHFIVADVRCLRLRLLGNLLETAYRTRNRPIGKRLIPILVGALVSLVREDLSELAQHRPPTFGLRAAAGGCRVALRLKRGTLRTSDLEAFIGATGIRRACFPLPGRHPAVSLPVLDCLSFALDIDTEEEALALAASRRPA
ncbi:MAG: nucleotidyltransferase family protein [Deltaproteobacteria bacterium]|nr:nucleotidyltransferase family protein [Deltaproteobacteria bacterium]